jgi:hypothetical protein
VHTVTEVLAHTLEEVVEVGPPLAIVVKLTLNNDLKMVVEVRYQVLDQVVVGEQEHLQQCPRQNQQNQHEKHKGLIKF